jgi:hypothetical protein
VQDALLFLCELCYLQAAMDCRRNVSAEKNQAITVDETAGKVFLNERSLTQSNQTAGNSISSGKVA